MEEVSKLREEMHALVADLRRHYDEKIDKLDSQHRTEIDRLKSDVTNLLNNTRDAFADSESDEEETDAPTKRKRKKRKVMIKTAGKEVVVSLDNVCELLEETWETTADFGIAGRKCLKIVENKMIDLMESKAGRQSLIALSEKPLLAILKSDELNVHTEKDVLLLIGAWIDNQLDKEAEKVPGKGKSKEDASENHLLQEILLWRRRGSNASQIRRGKEEPKKSKGSFAEDDEDMKEIPEEIQSKMTLSYERLLKARMENYMDYVRFPMMAAPQLLELDNTGFVPQKLLTEAYRHHFLLQTKGYKAGSKKNPRLRPRCYTLQEWDPERKGTGIQLSNDNKTVTKNQGCSQTTVITKNGVSKGRMSWELQLNQNAGCYSCIGICEREFDVNGSLLGVAANSFGYAMYPGMGNVNGSTRKQTASVVQAGVLVRVELDMDKGELVVYENNNEGARFTNVKKDTVYYLALTICHNSPPESYTLKPM